MAQRINTIRTFAQAVREASVRFVVCVKEAWYILRTVWHMFPTLHYSMRGVALLHMTLAVLSTMFPKLLGYIVNLLKDAHHGEAFLGTAAIIATAILILRGSHDVVLSFTRDMFVIRTFRIPLFLRVTQRTMRYLRKNRLEAEASDEAAAMLASGRINVTLLTEELLRDPFFACASFGILIYLAIYVSYVALVVLSRIVLELLITFYMDHVLGKSSSRLQQRDNRLRATEFKMFANPQAENWFVMYRHHKAYLLHYTRTWRGVQISRSWFEKIVRGSVSVVFVVLATVVAAWYEARGVSELGDFVAIVGYAETAVAPLTAIYLVQSNLMERRYSIHTLFDKLLAANGTNGK